MRWVRAFISIVVAAGIIYGFVVGKITSTDFLFAAGGTIAWWYVSRDKEKSGTDTKPNP